MIHIAWHRPSESRRACSFVSVMFWALVAALIGMVSCEDNTSRRASDGAASSAPGEVRPTTPDSGRSTRRTQVDGAFPAGVMWPPFVSAGPESNRSVRALLDDLRFQLENRGTSMQDSNQNPMKALLIARYDTTTEILRCMARQDLSREFRNGLCYVIGYIKDVRAASELEQVAMSCDDLRWFIAGWNSWGSWAYYSSHLEEWAGASRAWLPTFRRFLEVPCSDEIRYRTIDSYHQWFCGDSAQLPVEDLARIATESPVIQALMCLVREARDDIVVEDELSKALEGAAAHDAVTYVGLAARYPNIAHIKVLVSLYARGSPGVATSAIECALQRNALVFSLNGGDQWRTWYSETSPISRSDLLREALVALEATCKEDPNKLSTVISCLRRELTSDADIGLLFAEQIINDAASVHCCTQVIQCLAPSMHQRNRARVNALIVQLKDLGCIDEDAERRLRMSGLLGELAWEDGVENESRLLYSNIRE